MPYGQPRKLSNKQDLPQPLWDDIITHDPDFFLFLGDNIYGDTHNMDVLSSKYHKQDQQPDYQRLKNATNIIGVCDDHDYGLNDAGKEYSKKNISQQHFLDFFEVPAESPLRNRKGVYSSHQINWSDKKIKIILLDTRYHRDIIEKDNDGMYKPNSTGSILGTEQWKWLENELDNTKIDLFIVASGIQFIAEDHQYEKWSNFPNEREKLFDLVSSKKLNGLLFLSGDRHIAELSSITLEELTYPVFDITSSGLTHTWDDRQAKEYNQHREGELIAELNYGLLRITKTFRGDLVVKSQVRGNNQELFIEKDIKFNE